MITLHLPTKISIDWDNISESQFLTHSQYLQQNYIFFVRFNPNIEGWNWSAFRSSWETEECYLRWKLLKIFPKFAVREIIGHERFDYPEWLKPLDKCDYFNYESNLNNWLNIWERSAGKMYHKKYMDMGKKGARIILADRLLAFCFDIKLIKEITGLKHSDIRRIDTISHIYGLRRPINRNRFLNIE